MQRDLRHTRASSRLREKLPEHLLSETSEIALLGRLAIGCKVLDHHRQDDGEGGGDYGGGDAGVFCGLLDQAGGAEALLHLVRGCGLCLACGPAAYVVSHAVSLEAVEHSLDAFGVRCKRLDESACDLCLVTLSSAACLPCELRDRIENSHAFSLVERVLAGIIVLAESPCVTRREIFRVSV